MLLRLFYFDCLFSIVIFHCYFPLLFSIVIFHCYFPLLFSIVIFHCYLQVDDDESEASISEISPKVLARLNKKAPFQVAVAKYDYDPVLCSPNENPEAELLLSAGDYVLLFGEMDEVGRNVAQNVCRLH